MRVVRDVLQTGVGYLHRSHLEITPVAQHEQRPPVVGGIDGDAEKRAVGDLVERLVLFRIKPGRPEDRVE